MFAATQRQVKIVFFLIYYFSHLTCKLTNFFEEESTRSLVGGSDQRRLLKFLMAEKQYDPLERPVQNDSHTLPVTINLALQQIIHFVSQIHLIFIAL
jgi:hypothetical protein